MGLLKRKKRRLLLVRQHDVTNCAAACLSAVTAFYGGNMPIARVRQRAGTGKHGTSVAGIVEGAISIGFDAKGVKATFPSLQLTTLPAIAHIIITNGLLTFKHFVEYQDGRFSE